MQSTLAKVNAIKRLLAQIKTVPDAKVVRDKAEALRAVAKKVGYGLEAQNTCAEIKLRAERKGGQLLDEIIPHEGGKPSHNATVTSDFGIDRKQSSRWQLEASVPEEQFEQYIVETCEARKELTSISLVRLGKKEKRDRRRAKLVAKGKTAAQSPLLIGLHVGDIATVSAKLSPGSVDAIITDPPYSKEYLGLYATLSQSAATVLKPGGSCFVMAGQSYLPDVIIALSKALRYNWVFAYLTPGGMAAQLWNRKVSTFWKPVLWFVNGKYDGAWKSDVVSSKVNDDDKRFHEWGQSESGMLRIVERFTCPNDLVFDPFLGAGTTGVACLLSGRRFIGSDIDAHSVDLARGRLVEASALA